MPRPPHKQPVKPAPQSAGYYLYGGHTVLAALKNPARQKKKIVLTVEAQERHAIALSQCNIPIELLQKQEIERKLPPHAVHQGIALQTAPLSQPDLLEILQEADGRTAIVVLDQVTDPHNVGAILRSAAAFGAAAVVVQARHSPIETGVLAKAASGALEKVPYISVTNIARALGQLKEAGFWCLGMDALGTQNLATLTMPEQVALVYGAEGDGLRRLTKDHCDGLVYLQTSGDFSSLNVSNAVAVGLYEVCRGK